MNWGVLCLVVAGIMGRTSAIPPIVPISIVSVWCFVLLVRCLGRDLPLLEITASVYCLQLLVCPWVAYYGPTSMARYQMAVTDSEYFLIAIPTVCAFLIPIGLIRGLLPRLGQVMDLEAEDRVFSAGLKMVGIGLAFNVIYPYCPTSIRFAAYLVSEIRFVGVLYCYFSRHRQRRKVLVLVAAMMISSSIVAAMFHQVLIWGTILLSLVMAREIRNPSVALRASLLALGFVGVVFLESFKTSYREILRAQQERSTLAAINELLSTETIDEMRVWDVLRVRLNQGWIVSNVFKYIPKTQPYFGGETFVSAIADAFIPRGLIQKRVAAGGRESFRKMTGLKIGDSTSMGVSPLGEAYADFGPDGAVLAMFGFGAAYAGSYYAFCRWSKKNVLFFLWLPLVFSQAMKCETELAVVLNFLVKAALFSLIMYSFTHRLVFGKARLEIERRLAKGATKPAPENPRMVRSK